MFGPDDDQIPSTPDASEASLPVRRLFVTIVVLLNLGILAVSVAVMLVVFRGQLQRGAVLFLAGATVLAIAYRRYRSRHEVFANVD
ncbi:MAG: hypothetical protein ABEJ59_01000 [Halanaeroarchaeum sp.]